MEFDDDWDLSAEELDSIERDALRKIAERKSSSAAASASSSQETPTSKFGHSPAKPTMESDRNKVDHVPRFLPKSLAFGGNENDNAKELPKLSIRFFLHSSGNIAAKFPYDPILVGALHKIPKASWHGKERLWMFPVSSLVSAEKVVCEIDGANVEVEKLDPLVQRAIYTASALTDLRDLYDRMPHAIESKLLPFQRDGVRFILQHGGRALLADEMGLGKTLQAIAVAACVRDSWPVLILTPSSLRLHWASMIQQWLNTPSMDILVVLSQLGGSNRGGFKIVQSNSKGTIHLDGVFNIISYDVVPKLQDVLLASEFKVVIADESHFLKNAQAKRTTASLPILQKAQYAILLSGTPALSRPIELFKQLEALYPDVYKNVHEYGNRYCKGGIFGIYQGASNHEELHTLMKATVMIRRLKKDVLTELPVKRRQQVFLDLAEKDMKQINALFRELEGVKNKIKRCKSKEEVESLKFSQKNLINKIYTDSAEAKIPAVLDYLGTVIEAGCKFLIFAHHQPMIDSIFQFLLKKVGCIRIDGGTPASSRQTLVSDFQEKDDIKAAVLSIKAGGVGLTLTAASTVIFAELSWTPGDIIQAEDRAHRIGQVSSVNIYYLLANDTVDDIIWDVVQSKLENLGQMLDGHENTLEVSDNQPRSSPSKQGTLDSFIKRCNVSGNSGPPKLKHPRT
ncbi:SWI/SNF-related matrix-associated actin-dependent regulator of chromatin subfamily A-like protein 1 isoform X2 [Telopea speciosissima]|uniref:SWI/SNF-related matrix-associated actin-dependent regulator of chromatin subfamily A-like protein 1 isoform X2 n=1 Tax=Telopea speciosissima TaxID=54955 RepID=UPI001CC3D5FF|nr:SWI/SNF-related matrix-associated actin-dependent regulator of chromatin subfamily A-like protein 1 isoform X2 [Telopea speciosissima]